MMNRLQQQLNFLYEIDKLKTILRRSNLIADTSRFENTAEHSWHLGLYAIILAEYSNAKIDISRVIKLVLLHDIVEIDAGDTFCYDDIHNESKQEREQRAADRIFGLLPDDQRDELMNLWKEFEERKTPEAKFAASVDRLQPLLHNYVTGGGSWKRHGIKRHQVEARMQPIEEGSKQLFELIQEILDDSVKKEILAG